MPAASPTQATTYSRLAKAVNIAGTQMTVDQLMGQLGLNAAQVNNQVAQAQQGLGYTEANAGIGQEQLGLQGAGLQAQAGLLNTQYGIQQQTLRRARSNWQGLSTACSQQDIAANRPLSRCQLRQSASGHAGPDRHFGSGRKCRSSARGQHPGVPEPAGSGSLQRQQRASRLSTGSSSSSSDSSSKDRRLSRPTAWVTSLEDSRDSSFRPRPTDSAWIRPSTKLATGCSRLGSQDSRTLSSCTARSVRRRPRERPIRPALSDTEHCSVA